MVARSAAGLDARGCSCGDKANGLSPYGDVRETAAGAKEDSGCYNVVELQSKFKLAADASWIRGKIDQGEPERQPAFLESWARTILCAFLTMTCKLAIFLLVGKSFTMQASDRISTVLFPERLYS